VGKQLPGLSNDHGIWGSRKIPPTWLGADVSQHLFDHQTLKKTEMVLQPAALSLAP